MGEEEKSYSHERKPKFLEVNEDRRKTTGWALVLLCWAPGVAQLGCCSFFFVLILFYFLFSVLFD
jgi:hypothetical protein